MTFQKRCETLGRGIGATGLIVLATVLPLHAEKKSTETGNDEVKAYLSNQGYYPLPLELEKTKTREFLAIKTRISNSKATLYIDTASVWTRIDSYTARRLKTPDEMGITLVDSTFGPITNEVGKNGRLVVLPELHLGEAAFQNQPVVATGVKTELWSPDGFVGCDFLVRNHCILDCGRRMLYFRQERPPKEIFSARFNSLKQSGYGRVPVKLQAGVGLVCSIVISNTTVPVALGTAAGTVKVLDSSVATECGLSSMKGLFFHERLLGGGYFETEAHMLAPFRCRMGEWEFTSRFSAADLSGFGMGHKGPGKVDGLIGLEWLASVKALIDFDAAEVWIKP
jgi:hypothetical protein